QRRVVGALELGIESRRVPAMLLQKTPQRLIRADQGNEQCIAGDGMFRGRIHRQFSSAQQDSLAKAAKRDSRWLRLWNNWLDHQASANCGDISAGSRQQTGGAAVFLVQ